MEKGWYLPVVEQMLRRSPNRHHRGTPRYVPKESKSGKGMRYQIRTRSSVTIGIFRDIQRSWIPTGNQ